MSDQGPVLEERRKNGCDWKRWRKEKGPKTKMCRKKPVALPKNNRCRFAISVGHTNAGGTDTSS